MLTGNQIRQFQSSSRPPDPAPHLWPWLRISDFDDARVNPNSYNLRLGDRLLVYPENVNHFVCSYPHGVLGMMSPHWRGEHRRFLEECVDVAVTHDHPENYPFFDTAAKPDPFALSIPKEGRVLWPGILYLGHTVEETECRDLVPVIEGRSSVARCGIQIHSTAGFGDNGFRGQWTLEISCLFPVRVYAGSEICQIAFHQAEGRPGPYYAGRYQAQRGPVASGWWKDVAKTPGAE